MGCHVGVMGSVPEVIGPFRGEARPAMSGLRSPPPSPSPPCRLHGAARCFPARSRASAAALSLPTLFASSELAAEVDVAVLIGDAVDAVSCDATCGPCRPVAVVGDEVSRRGGPADGGVG